MGCADMGQAFPELPWLGAWEEGDSTSHAVLGTLFTVMTHNFNFFTPTWKKQNNVTLTAMEGLSR